MFSQNSRQKQRSPPHTRFICVRRCNSGGGSQTKKFSSTWFSHPLSQPLNAAQHSTQDVLCDSESASQLSLFFPNASHPSSCVLPYHPIHALFHLLTSLSWLSKTSMEGLNPGYLGTPDPSLIALSHDTESRLHDSADTLTLVHLPVSHLRSNQHPLKIVRT